MASSRSMAAGRSFLARAWCLSSAPSRRSWRGSAGRPYGFFIRWNIIGAIVWVGIFTVLGYFFGNIPFVQEHFELVIVAIVIVSLIPAVLEALKSRKEMRHSG